MSRSKPGSALAALRNKGGQLPFDMRFTEALEKCTRDLDFGCLLWNGARAGSGLYPVIRKGGKPVRVSRILLTQNSGDPPSAEHFACHTCDNPRCVEITHLFWGTPLENTRDAARKGRMNKPHGEHLLKIAEAVRRRLADPDVLAAQVARMQAGWALYMSDPVKRAAWKSRSGRRRTKGKFV